MNRYPFLRLLPPLVAGIVCGDVWPCPLVGAEWGLLGLFLLLIPIYIYPRLHKCFGAAVYLLLFAVGFLLMNRYLAKSDFPFANDRTPCRVRLLEPPEEKPRSLLCRSLVASEAGRGVFLLYFPKDSATYALRRGDELEVYTRLSPPEQFTDPAEFDYVRYLRLQGVSGTAYVPADSWEVVGHDPSRTLLQRALDHRERLISLYRRLGFAGDELAVLSALTVGYKEELSADIRRVYTNSGAAHILALSGMHVAFLFGLMWFVLAPLWRRGRWLRPLLAVGMVLALWAFAFFTGLSSSVVRAVVMCTFVVLAKLQYQRVLTLNTLCATAFLMLLVRPAWLFDVGFQLSFASVAAIILIHPRLAALLPVRNRCLRYVRDLFSLSVSAQIGAAPLVMLYFHSFATHFLLTNLLVVPLSSLILYAAVGMLLLTPFAGLQLWAVPVVEGLIRCQNSFLRWVEQLPFASLTGLRIDGIDAFFFYLALLALGLALHRTTARNVQLFLVVVLLAAAYHAFFSC